jgi:endonuclease/exonuclease/phosphatase family metal-dependent hydrolase
MKKKLPLLLFALTLSFSTSAQMVIASYNLRYANSKDIGNLWTDRAPIVVDLIRFHDFDVFGTQEALVTQLDYVSKRLPQYERAGIGRDDGKEAGEFSAIFYKKDKFTLLDKGDFWLSQTPDTPSLGWDAICCKRICSWVFLQDMKTERKFFFFNTHYDHQGVVARNESSKLILKKIKEIAGSNPVILTGDFNGSQSTEWYQKLADSKIVKDTFREARHPYANSGSFNGFGTASQNNDIIDHIFVSNQFTVDKWGLLTDTYNGKFPSDHFPVMAIVNLP